MWDELPEIVVRPDHVTAAYADEADEANIQYATFLYTREVRRIVRHHVATLGAEHPLFMFVSHQAPHMGVDVTKAKMRDMFHVNQPPKRNAQVLRSVL